MVPERDLTQIQRFYAGKSVLITGATGFIGRILLEKLLRSCSDIGTIYILVRPKKGKSIQERLDNMFEEVIFDKVKKQFPDFRKKVTAITGALELNELGMSKADRGLIIDEVSVIFHVAATVRFDEPLRRAVDINLNSTKEIVRLAQECKRLEAGVYVSTAYSNCIRSYVDEKVYPPPMTYEEVNSILETAEKHDNSEENMKAVEKLALENWPNTYTFTKTIAENVVAEDAKNLPFGIFRPSIVLGAFKEPTPGWVSGIMNLNGGITAMGLGAMHVAAANAHAICDIVPVDLVTNCLIATAWEIATIPKRRDAELPVYNYVSGAQNPLSWVELYSISENHGYEAASGYAVWHSFVIFASSEVLYNVLDFILHMMPALMLDCVRKLGGKKPFAYEIYCRLSNMLKSGKYFITTEWKFENERVVNLWDKLEPEDKAIFNFDIRDVVWYDYILVILKGLRKHALKEPDSTLPAARRKRFFLHILHNVVRVLLIAAFIWIVWKVFCGRTLQSELLYNTTLSRFYAVEDST